VHSLEDIEIRQIEPGDSFTGLSLGNPNFVPLKTFLRKHARNYHDQQLAKTYGAFNPASPQKLVAYITLVCGQIETENKQKFGPGIQYDYDHCPAVKIARLAVDHRLKRGGVGQALVDFSLGVIRAQICPWVGCRFVIVDSKTDAVDFYQRKCGFTLLDTEANKTADWPILFLDLYKLIKQEEAEAAAAAAVSAAALAAS
jgi:ribosomal protein S18 acetylase RimI-like enzyme